MYRYWKHFEQKKIDRDKLFVVLSNPCQGMASMDPFQSASVFAAPNMLLTTSTSLCIYYVDAQEFQFNL